MSGESPARPRPPGRTASRPGRRPRPATPAGGFAGTLVLEDAWRRLDLSGRRVAVIGPGREAALVAPTVLRSASAVKVFQEEPDWLLPAPEGVVGSAVGATLGRLGRAPALDRVLTRPVARLHLRRHVADPWVRRLLTPNRHAERRPGADVAFLDALADPRCTLVAWPVYALVPQGVRTAEGIEHRVDVVVLTPGSRMRASLDTAASPIPEETA